MDCNYYIKINWNISRILSICDDQFIYRSYGKMIKI